MSYELVPQEDFTPEHKKYVESLKNAYHMHFSEQKSIFYIKDIHSRYLSVSDQVASLAGLAHREDVKGQLDAELPWKAAEFAQDFVDEEKELLSYKDSSKQKSMLNIHEYATGLESLISHKYLITHHPSRSILGIKGVAYKVDLTSFFELMPNYLLEFGKVGNLENVNETLKIGNVKLTEYEHEVSYLVAANFSYAQIADFMNKYRPRATPRTADSIYKCRERVCHKFKCDLWDFRDMLIGMNIHRKIPNSFFTRLIGNRPLAS